MIHVHVTEKTRTCVKSLEDKGGMVHVKVENGGGGRTPVQEYSGEYVVDPKFSEQILETKDKKMRDDVTVNPIMVSRTTNLSGGTTVYIGGIINA